MMESNAKIYIAGHIQTRPAQTNRARGSGRVRPADRVADTGGSLASMRLPKTMCALE